MKKKELLAAFVLLLYGSHDALGQEDVAVVTAYEGDESVSLPYIMSQRLKNSPFLLWRRGRLEIVHIRDEDEDDHRDQNPVFKDRTEINPDAFQTGNLTLVLMKPTISDTGSYTCEVKEDYKEVGRTTVALAVVQRKDSPVGSIVGGVIAVLTLLVTVPVVLWLVWKKNLCSEENLQLSEAAVKNSSEETWVQIKQVTVSAGSASVLLKYLMKQALKSGSSVLWRREDRPSETVHLIGEQKDVLRGQSDEFKDRTEMKPDALKTGDLTLTLKYPKVSDSGLYSCEVKEGSAEKRLIFVELRVKVRSMTEPEPDPQTPLLS